MKGKQEKQKETATNSVTCLVHRRYRLDFRGATQIPGALGKSSTAILARANVRSMSDSVQP